MTHCLTAICVFFLLVLDITFAKESCDDTVKCLLEASRKMKICNRAFLNMARHSNATGCKKDVYDQQESLAELHQDQTWILANCIVGTELVGNVTCHSNDNNRFKRHIVLDEEEEKIKKFMVKVIRECENGDDILNTAKHKIDEAELTSRFDIVEYVKTNCNGSTTLDIDDLPGMDLVLEKFYEKVKRNCSNNWNNIMHNLTLQYQKQKTYSWQQAIHFIISACKSQVTTTADVLLTPNDVKMKKFLWQIQKNCLNADDLIEKLQKLESRAIITKQQMLLYINMNCKSHGSNFTDELLDPIFNFSTFDQNAFTMKLTSTFAIIDKRCKNGSTLSKSIQHMLKQTTMNTTEEFIEYVEKYCDGTANLTFDEVPTFGCHAAAGEMLNKCIATMDKCSLAERCQECLSKTISPTILAVKTKLEKTRENCNYLDP